MNSCLYECAVMHQRLAPRQHRFEYGIFMFYLDLDELDETSSRVLGFGHNRWNAYSFNDNDHFLGGTGTAKERLVRYLAENGIAFPEGGSVRLLTLPRVFGYVFNPVSLYFCFDPDGRAFCSVAEVGNTFRESKPFLLRDEVGKDQFRLIVPKNFYVSPFSALDLKFDFKLRAPAETLEIHIDDMDGGNTVLLSALTGKRAPLTSGRLAWFTLKYPFITLKVIALIHWQALRLWAKRMPWHSKEANPELQQGVLNPRSS